MGWFPSNSMYFSSLLILPNIIDGPGEYKTRRGEMVTIETLYPGSRFKIRAYGYYHIPIKIKERWYPSGRISGYTKTLNDIVSKLG